MTAAAFNPARFLPSAAYKKAGILVESNVLPGTSAATSTNYNHFYIAPYKVVVLSVDFAWSTASNAGTVDLLKASDGTAISAGTSLLTGTVNTAATANTVASGTLSSTAATVQLTTGQRLGINSGGTLTSLTDLVITVVMAPIPSSN